MKKAKYVKGIMGWCISALAVLPGSEQLLAQEPTTIPDSFYHNGHDFLKDNVRGAETWTFDEPMEDSPFKAGDKFTLWMDARDRFFVSPARGLKWGASDIPLKNHPAYEQTGETKGWRWMSATPITINRRPHGLCIGFPDDGNTREDPADDSLFVAVVEASSGNWEESCEPPDTREPQPYHAGHAHTVR